jgi:serine beta-lactamase-like protein LACTB
VRESVAVIEADPPLFAPGEGFAYTSLGFNLVGLAVEVASGEPFDAYVDRAVAGPLGLSSLRVERVEDPGTTGFYDVEPRGFKLAYPVDHSLRVPSGGFRATPTDVATLGLAMTDERLLPRAVQEALLTVPPGGDDEDAAMYAHGWRVGGWNVDGVGPLIHHNGTAVGSRSILVISREDGVVVSLMVNDGGDSIRDLTPIASDLLRVFVLDPAPG